MSAIVLDNSVVLSWRLQDETQPLAEQVMHHVNQFGAVVSDIWWHESQNASVMKAERGPLSTAHAAVTLADVH